LALKVSGYLNTCSEESNDQFSTTISKAFTFHCRLNINIDVMLKKPLKEKGQRFFPFI